MSIHPTAIVDRRTNIDASVEIGPYCVIDANVVIGAGCRLYQGVYVTGWTTIGERCELHPHVIVGHVPQDTKYHGERSFCRIGDNTILRENVTIHRGTIPESKTIVGDDCFLLGGSHVAHNCVIGNRVTLINNVLLAGHVAIGDRVTIGGGTAIHQFVRVGELAMVAGVGRLTMDVPPFMLTDPLGRIAGLNRVGIRRAELPREDVAELREAFRILYGSGRLFREAVEMWTSRARTASGLRLVEFLQAESRRGIAGRTRGHHGDVEDRRSDGNAGLAAS